MINYSDLIHGLADTPLAHWRLDLEHQLQARLENHNNGNLPKFLAALRALPSTTPAHRAIDQDVVMVGTDSDLSTSEHSALTTALAALMPWRKGPFNLFGHLIDTEWQCNMKWARIAPHLNPLHGRIVLDVGSGNGYYGWRMLGAGAARVIGIDPSWLSVTQHCAINHFLRDDRHHILPLTLEEMTPNIQGFDTAFSMGVLYHRRSPLDHLEELRNTLRPGGELVLETLVIDGKEGESLVPEGRYARMNNVWFLPSVPSLISWCRKMGFEDVRCVDITSTSTEEQRTTRWKPGQSLADYLDQENPKHTIEGHPAPLRATILAQRPFGGRLARYGL
ncbi:tRNA 5-methoxyuridine(34)/uridine 5-oxyacetic acid(34) synthase CmoB [Salinispirillum sp. LH 10-3-1]|uniref:tRNA U34 carboxymethyltransferase n=1 Tax=Salinispirillum sp. LH 10-3-1 TaxID=2952525 RepID=A0AB38YDD7_9GAMM